MALAISTKSTVVEYIIYFLLQKGADTIISNVSRYLLITARTRSFAISRCKPVLFSKALPLLADAPEEDQSEIDIGLRRLTRVYSQLGIEFIDNWCQIGSGSSHFSKLCPNFKFHLNTVSEDCSFASDIQKANIMVTEHWLKLVFWKSALQNGALLWDAKMRSMTSSYPEDIALSLLQTLSSLPSESVKIHGLGIVSAPALVIFAPITKKYLVRKSIRRC